MHAQLGTLKADRFGLILVSLLAAMVAAPVFAKAPAVGPTIEAAEAQAVPEIQAEKTVHDFGMTWSGPRLKCDFTVKNVGEAVLVIRGVTPSDRAVMAGLHPKSIKPGASGKFPFFLNTNQVHGEFAISSTVLSNDPKTPKLELTIKGVVKHRIEIAPPEADFGPVYGNGPKTQVIKITNHLDTPLVLALDPFASTRKFRFKLTETEPGQAFELEVKTVPPFDKSGKYSETAVMMTNQSQLRQLRIQASVVVKDRLDVEPTELILDKPTPSKPGNDRGDTVLTFTNFGDKQVQVVDVSVNDEKLKVNVHKQTDNVYRIALDVPADYEIPNQGRTVTIKTDDAEKPILTVPIKKKPQRQARLPKKSEPRPAEMIVGEEAPEYSLTTVNGQAIRKDGKITVLNFYASRCPFCRRQLPRVDKVRPEYEAKGVQFVNVVIPWRGAPLVEATETAFLKQINVQGVLALDTSRSASGGFKVGGVPSMAIVGKTGKVEAVNIGNKPDLEVRIKAQLDALLADKPIPAEYLPVKE